MKPINNKQNVNLLIYNENNQRAYEKFVQKRIEKGDSLVLIGRTENELESMLEVLKNAEYAIETVDFDSKASGLRVNPFDLVKPGEPCYAIDNIFYALYNDEFSKDSAAMLQYTRAMAQYLLEQAPAEKRTVASLKKMLAAATQKKKVGTEEKRVDELLFDRIKDEKSLALKAYKKFLSIAGGNESDAAKATIEMFDQLSDDGLSFFSETDIDSLNLFDRKTALVLLASDAHSDAVRTIYLAEMHILLVDREYKTHVTVAIDDLNKRTRLANLPYAVENTAEKCSFLIFVSNIGDFERTEWKKTDFKRLQQCSDAIVLVSLDKDDVNNATDKIDIFVADSDGNRYFDKI